MFSLKSWFTRQRPPDDDELISAYMDGDLDASARRAFEARMASEPALRRQVDATRQLIETAAQLPLVSVPRSFTLPVSSRKPSAPPATWLRVGSAFAAAVFVFAVGLDVSGVLAPRTLAPASAPQAARSFAVQATAPAAAPAAEATSISDREDATVPEAAANSAAAAPTSTPEATATPLAVGGGMGGGLITDTADMSASILAVETTTIPPAVSAKQPPSDTVGISGLEEVTQAQSYAAVQSTAAPEPTAPAEQPAPVTPETPWWRILAGAALVLAVGMGIAGWARR